MVALPFIDTHVHFWDLRNPDLYYSWLQKDAPHPYLTGKETAQLGSTDYTVENYFCDVRDSDVIACVHVQCATGIDDPVLETSWLQAAADRTGWPQAIIAMANLSADDARTTLERHARHRNFRGVRDYKFGNGAYLRDPRWKRGFRLLADMNLVCSIDCTVDMMPQVDELLSECPGTRTVIDHMGFPQSRDDDCFVLWSRGMRRIAAHPQAICKISEMGMVEHGWTIDVVRRWVLACVEIFGPERCIFGTDWPVGKLYSSYDDLVAAYRRIIGEFSLDEQRAMLSENAARIYRLPMDTRPAVTGPALG